MEEPSRAAPSRAARAMDTATAEEDFDVDVTGVEPASTEPA
jgi:hypothetical protein